MGVNVACASHEPCKPKLQNNIINDDMTQQINPGMSQTAALVSKSSSSPKVLSTDDVHPVSHSTELELHYTEILKHSKDEWLESKGAHGLFI